MVWLVLLLPVLAAAQNFEFELKAGAFPVEINGWQPFQPWSGGINATTPDLCDLDNDGDLDFYCGQAQGYVVFFQNIGNNLQPIFQYVTYHLDSLQYPGVIVGWGYSDIDFADMDADADKDAILGGGYVLIYPNIGTSIQSNFNSQPDTLRVTGGSYVLGPRVAVADLDNDGDFDVFAGQISGTIRYYENIGTTTSYSFQLSSTNWQAIQIASDYTDPCFADLDADGDLDLLVGTGAGTVYYYRNDGTAQNADMVLVSNNYLGIDVQEDASPELADIDGDGDLDLFVGRSPDEGQSVTQGDVYNYENVGTPQMPNFQFVTSNYLTWDCGFSSTPRLVDIDADGDPDLFSHIGDRLLFYRNQGTAQNPFFIFESDSFESIQVFDLIPWFVDIDGDGDYDLLTGESAIPGPPGLHLYLNQGTPQDPRMVLYSDDLLPGVFTQNSVILSPWTADIDADGDQDLFVSADGLYFLENVGSPSNFQFQLITNLWQNVGAPMYGLLFGCFWDIDQDQDLDLFINSEAYYYQPWDKNLMFYRNVGTPQNAQMVLGNEDLFPELMIWQPAPFLLDMDQDGDGDMFVGDTWGGIRYFKNVTGDTSAVSPPPIQRHPQAGMQISLGPNPANPNTVISFSLPFAQQIDLAVYNLLGARLTTLASGPKLPGSYVIPWEASGNASGVYIIRLQTPQQSFSEKLTIIK